MKMTILSALFSLALFAMPSQSLAEVFELDYNDASYSSSITGTFNLPSDYGLVMSADFSVLVRGRLYRQNNWGDGWYYENKTDLSIGSQGLWDNKSLPGDFMLYTFSLNQSALDELNATKQITFYLIGEDADWWSDLGSSGVSPSRNYLDYAQLDVTTTPIPGAVWLLGSGIVGLVGLRRKMKA